MGSIIAASEHWRPLRARARHSGASAGLLVDEERTDVGRHAAAYRRNLDVSAQGIAAQTELLTELIGEQEGAGALAASLIASFGSLARVVAAAPQAIELVIGDAAIGRRIVAAREAVLASQLETISQTVFDLREVALQRYIVGLFQGLRDERLHVFFLDGSHRYLSDERISEGNCAFVSGSLRKLVSRAILIGATGLVLVHNHPSGITTASEADIVATRRLGQSLADLELTLVDHLIVAGTTILSMRGAGLL